MGVQKALTMNRLNRNDQFPSYAPCAPPPVPTRDSPWPVGTDPLNTGPGVMSPTGAKTLIQDLEALTLKYHLALAHMPPETKKRAWHSAPTAPSRLLAHQLIADLKCLIQQHRSCAREMIAAEDEDTSHRRFKSPGPRKQYSRNIHPATVGTMQVVYSAENSQEGSRDSSEPSTCNPAYSKVPAPSPLSRLEGNQPVSAHVWSQAKNMRVSYPGSDNQTSSRGAHFQQHAGQQGSRNRTQSLSRSSVYDVTTGTTAPPSSERYHPSPPMSGQYPTNGSSFAPQSLPQNGPKHQDMSRHLQRDPRLHREYDDTADRNRFRAGVPGNRGRRSETSNSDGFATNAATEEERYHAQEAQRQRDDAAREERLRRMMVRKQMQLTESDLRQSSSVLSQPESRPGVRLDRISQRTDSHWLHASLPPASPEWAFHSADPREPFHSNRLTWTRPDSPPNEPRSSTDTSLPPQTPQNIYGGKAPTFIHTVAQSQLAPLHSRESQPNRRPSRHPEHDPHHGFHNHATSTMSSTSHEMRALSAYTAMDTHVTAPRHRGRSKVSENDTDDPENMEKYIHADTLTDSEMHALSPDQDVEDSIHTTYSGNVATHRKYTIRSAPTVPSLVSIADSDTDAETAPRNTATLRQRSMPRGVPKEADALLPKGSIDALRLDEDSLRSGVPWRHRDTSEPSHDRSITPARAPRGSAHHGNAPCPQPHSTLSTLSEMSNLSNRGNMYGSDVPNPNYFPQIPSRNRSTPPSSTPHIGPINSSKFISNGSRNASTFPESPSAPIYPRSLTHIRVPSRQNPAQAPVSMSYVRGPSPSPWPFSRSIPHRATEDMLDSKDRSKRKSIFTRATRKTGKIFDKIMGISGN